jgi:hypothetical protein
MGGGLAAPARASRLESLLRDDAGASPSTFTWRECSLAGKRARLACAPLPQTLLTRLDADTDARFHAAKVELRARLRSVLPLPGHRPQQRSQTRSATLKPALARRVLGASRRSRSLQRETTPLHSLLQSLQVQALDTLRSKHHDLTIPTSARRCSARASPIGCSRLALPRGRRDCSHSRPPIRGMSSRVRSALPGSWSLPSVGSRARAARSQ